MPKRMTAKDIGRPSPGQGSDESEVFARKVSKFHSIRLVIFTKLRTNVV